MIANALIVSFVASFIAIAAFGHLLLFLAIWPQWAAKRQQTQPELVDEPARAVTVSN
jgi:hypothetical protein